MAELFPEPDRFIPERWTREKHRQTPLAFSVIPFGFGTRMCIGRHAKGALMNVAMSQLWKPQTLNTIHSLMNGMQNISMARSDYHLSLGVYVPMPLGATDYIKFEYSVP